MSAEAEKQIRQALADKHLQSALKSFTALTKIGRQMGMTGIDFPVLRQDLHNRKERAIDHLPQLIVQFKKNACDAGAIVFEAKTAEEAVNYVLKLARERGVKNIVKSKSMVSEEIDLRGKLEQVGIRVDETDIGERIVQLAGERPAHIVGPAIHKTREQIAGLFGKLLDREISTDAQILLDTARESLRDSYLKADMGISGANIAIADSGTLVILTNEGNGQMVTTLAPIHIAIVGIEKIVHDFADANAVLRLLSRSCVGTKMTSYVSFITGISKVDNSCDSFFPAGQGPRELHIILLDNGRSTMRESEMFRQALYCIKCGSCLNICPVFASVSGQTYGYVYQGGIGTVLTAFYHGWQLAHELAEMCMGCLSCRDVCPADIDIPQMIREVRKKYHEEKILNVDKTFVYRAVLKNPGVLNMTVKAGRFLQKPFVDRDAMIRKLPLVFGKITDIISLPSITPASLRDCSPTFKSTGDNDRSRVAFFSGCVASYLYTGLGESVLQALNNLNVIAIYPPDQTCCGAPVYFNGDSKTTLSMAVHNIEVLLETGADYIVTVCPGCAVMLKKEYLRLTEKDKILYSKALSVSGKIRDFSQLMIGHSGKAEVSKSGSTRVTYHDPCHLKRGLGIWLEPRKLIEVAGLELVEMDDADACCGFGGDSLLTHPDLCGSILNRKLDNIEATGADAVITACTACVLQLRGGLDKRGSKIKVVHIADLFKVTGHP